MKQDKGIFLNQKIVVVVFLLVFTALLASCQPGSAAPASPETTPVATEPLLTPTPSATSIPLAASVNGGGIPLAEYQAELLRYQDAMSSSGAEPARNEAGTPLPASNSIVTPVAYTLTDADKKAVLEDLLSQSLLAQAAIEKNPLPPETLASGLMWDKTVVDEHYAKLVEQTGGAQTFNAWLTANHYTEPDFKFALSRALAAAWMRDQIIAGVPKSGEQIHSRQILTYSDSEAKNVLARIQAGEKYEDLAAEYDPVGLGEMGWYPKGYLLQPELEAAAFALQPDQYSQVVQTRLGYHIIQILAREQERLFTPDALLTLQMKAVQDWLAARRGQSDVKILIP